MDLKTLNSALPPLMALIRKGVERKILLKKYDEELVSIAYARVRDAKIGKDLLFNEDDLRFATNPIVAKWRAQRLKCDTLIEIGCGVGIQTLEFAKSCKRVIAVDNDRRKVEYAKQNAISESITNVEFIVADGIEFLGSQKKADIIFIDPQRLASEPARSLDTIKPSIPDILKVAGKLTKRIAIELPPQIKCLYFDCEKEYSSIRHELNRLTVYFGPLKNADTSAVMLPEGEVLTPQSKAPLPKGPYLYEIDPAVIKAGLHDSLGLRPSGLQGLYCANKRISSPFIKHVFKMIYEGANNPGQIRPALRGIGKIVLRAQVASKDYWDLRKKYELGLSGPGVAHLFIEGGMAYVCELLF